MNASVKHLRRDPLLGMYFANVIIVKFGSHKGLLGHSCWIWVQSSHRGKRVDGDFAALRLEWNSWRNPTFVQLKHLIQYTLLAELQADIRLEMITETSEEMKMASLNDDEHGIRIQLSCLAHSSWNNGKEEGNVRDDHLDHNAINLTRWEQMGLLRARITQTVNCFLQGWWFASSKETLETE